MNHIKDDEINGLIYCHPLRQEPSRYEMVRYSTWRVYFFQELEAMASDKIAGLKCGQSWIEKYPHLVTNNEEKKFYGDFLNDKKSDTMREDIISHFICRMLYCQDTLNHAKFIEMEKQILSIRLFRKIGKEQTQKVKLMSLLKCLLASLLQRKGEEFNVPTEDWNKYGHKIIRKDTTAHNAQSISEFAMVPLEFGQSGLKRRFAFVRSGNVYLNIENTIELVVNLYGAFLKQKLQKMKVAVVDLLQNDVENQLNGFLRKTLDTLNTSSFDESAINSQFKLNIKNVDSLWKKFYPPCMLNLTQKLKQYNHLKHQGRRQLWLFLKGCGMDANDNQAYFHKHFASKVSASDLKSHMYNIQHAYGIVGKKQPQRPKICRNIITGPAPKKDEHHGCPFAHWRSQDLKEYLRKNYNISEVALEEVIKEKQENHFQVACGRLFEGVAKAQGHTSIPSQITSMLGKSPHEYFQAGMELVNYNNNKGGEKKQKKMVQKQTIQF